MAKSSTRLVVIFAVVLTVATGARLIELNRGDALNLMSLKPDLAIWMPNIGRSIGISAVRCSQRTPHCAKSWLSASHNLQNESPLKRAHLRAVDRRAVVFDFVPPRPTVPACPVHRESGRGLRTLSCSQALFRVCSPSNASPRSLA
jgi:hypothetical protein